MVLCIVGDARLLFTCNLLPAEILKEFQWFVEVKQAVKMERQDWQPPVHQLLTGRSRVLSVKLSE